VCIAPVPGEAWANERDKRRAGMCIDMHGGVMEERDKLIMLMEAIQDVGIVLTAR
jgi:hypothetical protein